VIWASVHFAVGGLPWVTHQQADSAGIWLPRQVQVGWGVSEVLAAFVTTPTGHVDSNDT
jgi:hypothetical protein